MPACTTRPAELADLPRLLEIYNHYVVQTPVTFDLEPVSLPARRVWFEQFALTGRHRLWVAERSGTLLGYAASHQFRVKRAYDTTVEPSVYCAPEACGQGVGGALYAAMFAALRDEDIHAYVAGITLPNEASLRLHERFGFTLSGVMHGVGRKFGSYWDVAWYEKVSAKPEQAGDGSR
jgi:phosphinothricin acetyltransferase